MAERLRDRPNLDVLFLSMLLVLVVYAYATAPPDTRQIRYISPSGWHAVDSQLVKQLSHSTPETLILALQTAAGAESKSLIIGSSLPRSRSSEPTITTLALGPPRELTADEALYVKRLVAPNRTAGFYAAMHARLARYGQHTFLTVTSAITGDGMPPAISALVVLGENICTFAIVAPPPARRSVRAVPRHHRTPVDPSERPRSEPVRVLGARRGGCWIARPTRSTACSRWRW